MSTAYLLGTRQQILGNPQAEGIDSLHVEEKLELRRPLDGQVAPLGALQDPRLLTGTASQRLLEIGADCLIYQNLDALLEDVRSVNPRVTNLEASCFSGIYVTGDVTPEYLAGVEANRNDVEMARRLAIATTQLDLNLATAD